MCQLGALRASLVPWDHRCVIFRKHLKWPDGRNTLGPICTLSGGSHTWSDHVRPCEIPVTERLLGPRCVTRVRSGARGAARGRRGDDRGDDRYGAFGIGAVHENDAFGQPEEHMGTRGQFTLGTCTP